MNDKKVIAFFDVDNTLVDGSTGPFLVRYMYSLGMVPVSALFKVLYLTLLYKLNRLPHEQAYGWTAQLLSGSTAEQALALTDAAHEKLWLHRYYAEGREAIRRHKEMGHLTVIATSASDYIGALVRDQLGADDSFGTQIMTDDKGTLLNEIPPRTAYGPGKLLFAQEYAQQVGADLADAWFYSDSASDWPLLSAVGKPILVNPQRKLIDLARGKNMQTVWWSQHLKGLEPAKPKVVQGVDISQLRK